MTREEARALTNIILSFATEPELEVNVVAGRRAHLRFARNLASTSGVSETVHIGVTAWKGKRKASVSAAITSAPSSERDAALRNLVSEAEALAALSPEDPEYLPPLGPQKYLDVNAYDAATAEMSPAVRAKTVADAIAQAKNKKLIAAGIFRNSGLVHVMANKAGLFAYFPS
ncbi:MAG: TldD/PmbA family protein, partial [Acidobacteria bacterium]|nr:TldD/PmbA family protein [Acidobacteriota bacterium]